MHWTRVVVPAEDGANGSEIDRIVRDVSTEEAMRELDARLVAAGLTAWLAGTWLKELRDRTQGNMDGERVATPGQVLDPDAAEHYVSSAVAEAKRVGPPKPVMPPLPRPRRL